MTTQLDENSPVAKSSLTESLTSFCVPLISNDKISPNLIASGTFVTLTSGVISQPHSKETWLAISSAVKLNALPAAYSSFIETLYS